MTNHKLEHRFPSSCGQIAYGSDGDGSIDVVLVHGTPANSIVWRPVIERLKSAYRFHYFDLPGFGASEKFEGQEVRLRAFARVLRELIAHLGLDRPHLVGHDFGAATVLGAILVEHVAAASVAIADGVVLNPWGTPYSLHVKRHEQVFAAVPDHIHRATLTAHLSTAVHRPMPPETETALIAPWLGEHGRKAYYRQVAQYDHDYTARLETLYATMDIPALILWGEADRWVDIAEGRRLQTRIRQAKMETIADAGHFSMIDCPGRFAALLHDWLGSAPALNAA